MGMPAVVKQTGTGIAIWMTDWSQTPFQIGYAAIFSGAACTANIDCTFDNPVSTDINGTSTPTWFTVNSLATANLTANFTTPVQAFRVNVMTAVATSVVTVTFVQATFPR